MSLLSVENVTAGYGDVQVLWGIDLRVEQGEIVALIGSNGVGKSTLLRTISGLLPTRSGRITLGDADIGGLPPIRSWRRASFTSRKDGGCSQR
jgi:ABC-type branched-chain amino acid transport systems, ATPase component